MANICTADTKVRGYKSCIDEFINTLKRGYSYFSEPPKVNGFHFFRIFDVEVYEYEHTVGVIYMAKIMVDCAWSVYCCMMPGMLTYYNDMKEAVPPEQFKGTNIIQESQRLNLAIEIYSEELGMGFQEHYWVNDGIQIASEEQDNLESYYLEQDTYKEYQEQWGDDDRIHSEEEYQALRSQADEEGFLVIGGLNTDWHVQDEPNYMVNLVAIKEAKKR